MNSPTSKPLNLGLPPDPSPPPTPPPPSPPPPPVGSTPDVAQRIGANQSLQWQTTAVQKDAYFVVKAPCSGILSVTVSGMTEKYRLYIADGMKDSPLRGADETTTPYSTRDTRQKADVQSPSPVSAGDHLIRAQPLSGHSKFQIDVRFPPCRS